MLIDRMIRSRVEKLLRIYKKKIVASDFLLESICIHWIVGSSTKQLDFFT